MSFKRQILSINKSVTWIEGDINLNNPTGSKTFFSTLDKDFTTFDLVVGFDVATRNFTIKNESSTIGTLECRANIFTRFTSVPATNPQIGSINLAIGETKFITEDGNSDASLSPDQLGEGLSIYLTATNTDDVGTVKSGGYITLEAFLTRPYFGVDGLVVNGFFRPYFLEDT